MKKKINELNQFKASEKDIERKFKYFHKTGDNGYAQFDEFLGITVPNIRSVAKKYYKEVKIDELQELLDSNFHEYRLFALIILTYKMKIADKKEEKEIYEFYLKNTKNINGWDLVDLSCYEIVGKYLAERKSERKILYELVKSDLIWERRIAIVSTMYFIRKLNEFEDTLKLADELINDKEDLIHKATGWLLREVGKKDYKVEYNYLKIRYNKMPRTALRYAIERFDENTRQDFLKGKI